MRLLLETPISLVSPTLRLSPARTVQRKHPCIRDSSKDFVGEALRVPSTPQRGCSHPLWTSEATDIVRQFARIQVTLSAACGGCCTVSGMFRVHRSHVLRHISLQLNPYGHERLWPVDRPPSVVARVERGRSKCPCFAIVELNDITIFYFCFR
jgi:hypothetical protein